MVVSALDDGGEDEGKDDIVIVRTLCVRRSDGRRGKEFEKGGTKSWQNFYKNMTYRVDKGEIGQLSRENMVEF